MKDDIIFDAELEDYIDSQYDPDLDPDLTEDEREELKQEEALLNQLKADFKDNDIEEDIDGGMFDCDDEDDDIRKYFPTSNNEEYRPRSLPTFSGCVMYLLFQGLILLIFWLIADS